MLSFALFLKSFTTLFAVVNPMSTAPLFLAFMHEEDKATVKRAVLTVALTVFITLVFFTIFGLSILNLFGISIAGFQISAGIILLIMALSMLRAQTSRIKQTKGEREEAEAKDNPAIFPLSIPLCAGPGAITTVIVMAHENPSFVNHIMIIAMIALLCLSIFLILSFARLVSKKLGKTGLNVITRIMGMSLAAVAIEIMISGLIGVFPVLKGFTGA